MIARREFLGGAVAVAGSLMMPGLMRVASADAGKVSGGADAPRVLVDWHSHFVTSAEIRFLSERNLAPRIFLNQAGKSVLENATTASAAGNTAEFEASDIAVRIRHLDQNGIARQLLSHTVALGLDATLSVAELRVLFRAVNNELGDVVRRYPDRFFAVAALPTGDPEWAAEELKRAHQELGLIGGSLPLNAFSTLEGARTLAPVFAAGQKLGSHFFVHRGPANPQLPGQPPVVVPADTASARWSLISNAHLAGGAITLGLTDFLDPYPDVSVQIVMLAGFLPYLTDTLVAGAQRAGIKDPLARLRRIYVDPGPYSRNAEWVLLAAQKLGADRILFGTDYGVGGGNRGDVGPALATLDKALSGEQRQLIYIDNSRNLLRSKGRNV